MPRNKKFVTVAVVVALSLLLTSCGTPNNTAVQSTITQSARDGKITVDWSRAVGAMNPFLQPGRFADTLCTVSARGEVHYTHIDGRRPKAAFTMPFIGDEYTAAAGCADDAVAAVTENGILIVTNDRGQVKWQKDLRKRVIAAPLIVGRRILTLGLDARVSAWTLDRGKLLWSYISPLSKILRTSVESSLEVNDKTVYAGLNDSVLVVLNLADGNVMWENTIYLPRQSNRTADIQDVTTPVTNGNLVCAGAYQSGVACFDARRGNKLWDTPMSVIRRVDMDTAGARLFVSDIGGKLHAFDTYSGQNLWTVQTPWQLSAPTYIKGAVLVGDETGIVHAFAPDTGERITFLQIGTAPLTYLRRLPGTDDAAIALAASGTLARLHFEF